MAKLQPGAIIELIQHELQLSPKQLAEQLHISEVWFYRLTRHNILPSFHILSNLLTLYLGQATDQNRPARQQRSRDLLDRCSEVYIDQQLQRIHAKAEDLFRHRALTTLTNS